MEDRKTILIVEDDKYIIHFLSISLKEEDYGLWTAKTVKEAVSLFYANRPDLVILDLGLPDGDGMEVIESIREIADTPIIIVSARLDEDEKIRALDAGADDYVTKPFYMGELQAFEKRQVTVAGEEIHLTPIEYRILTLLIANRGKVLTHNYILKEIWGYAEGVEAGTLRVFVATLRRKIEKNPSQPQHIVTEVGVGYRFR